MSDEDEVQILTPLRLLSPSRSPFAVGPVDITRPGQPSVLTRDSLVAAHPDHEVHTDPEVQESLVTMLQLAVGVYRELPDPDPARPDFIGFATCPATPTFPARTYLIVLDNELVHLEFHGMGPLLTLEQMRNRVWIDMIDNAAWVKQWYLVFGRYFDPTYYDSPEWPRLVEATLRLAKVRHENNILRQEMGMPTLPVNIDDDLERMETVLNIVEPRSPRSPSTEPGGAAGGE